MTVRHKAIVGRRAQAAMRLLVAGGVALALAGCMESKVARQRICAGLSPASSDHAEGGRSHRRSLPRPQSRRTDAQPARRCAGLCADLEARGHERHHRRGAARRRHRSCRSRLDARDPFHPERLGRAAQCRLCAAVPPVGLGAGKHQAELLEAGRGSGTVRQMAERPRHIAGLPVHRKPDLLEFRLRQPAQSRRHGRQPGRPCAAARRRAGLCRPPQRCDRQIPPGRIAVRRLRRL